MGQRDSNTDIAYRLMQKRKKERNFYDLWEDVKKELAKILPPEQMENIDDDISFFYTNLTLDGRFVNVGDNKWNLRERVKFENVHIDMNEIYAEDEEESETDSEDKEDKEDSDEGSDSFEEEETESKSGDYDGTDDFSDDEENN